MSIVVLRVLLRPLFLWLLAVFMYWYLAGYVVDLFSSSTLLSGLANAIESNAKWVALVPFVMGAISMLERLQILHEWSKESIAGCNYCAGPQKERSGQYGPYRKCFICQRNEKIR